MKPNVHWEEGQHLKPHHFQLLQRHFGAAIDHLQRLVMTHPYGVLRLDLAESELERRIVRFNALHVILKSGVEVRYPGPSEDPASANAQIAPLDITDALAAGPGELTVYLGVPHYHAAQANVHAGPADDGGVRFYSHPIAMVDENTGENRQLIMVRYVNAKLLLRPEIGYETLPLLRISSSGSGQVGRPVRSRGYEPPCMVLTASQQVFNLTKGLCDQLLAAREELVMILRSAEYAPATLRGMQVDRVLRLQTLNRFAARLPMLLEAGSRLSPAVFYLELRELLGELGALDPRADPFPIQPYEHDHPLPSFLQLAEVIPPHLLPPRGHCLVAAFHPEGEHLTVHLSDQHLTQASAYYLGVQATQPQDAIRAAVLNRDAFMLLSKTKEFEAVYGVELRFEADPPADLPGKAGMLYFRLVTIENGSPAKRWKEVEEARCAILKWKANVDLRDARFALYMPLSGEAS